MRLVSGAALALWWAPGTAQKEKSPVFKGLINSVEALGGLASNQVNLRIITLPF